MERVSSSATLLLKFFIPTFWMVFFGSFTAALFFSGIGTNSRIPVESLKIGAVLFFLLGFALLYWSVMRLKRVELDGEFVYVTNYFKTFRYPYSNVERMEESDYLFFRSMHIYLLKPGAFGKRITFVVSQKLMDDFLKGHPEVARHFLGEVS